MISKWFCLCNQNVYLLVGVKSSFVNCLYLKMCIQVQAIDRHHTFLFKLPLHDEHGDCKIIYEVCACNIFFKSSWLNARIRLQRIPNSSIFMKFISRVYNIFWIRISKWLSRYGYNVHILIILQYVGGFLDQQT